MNFSAASLPFMVDWVADMIAPYSVRDFAARSSPTFQLVQPGECLRGFGMRPDFTFRQVVASEQPYKADTTGRRTSALSGNRSKFCNALGTVSDFDISTPFAFFIAPGCWMPSLEAQ